MMWFDKDHADAVFMDKREVNETLCDGRSLIVSPDVIADFTNIPFNDESFYLVAFDPPHLRTLGEKSWLAKKYGKLYSDWEIEIREGFNECFRVLKTNGVLIFKWNETEITLGHVLSLAPKEPLFGHTTGRQSKTIWCAFIK